MEIPDKKAMCALIVSLTMKNISVYSICVTFYSFAKEKKRRFYDDF